MLALAATLVVTLVAATGSPAVAQSNDAIPGYANNAWTVLDNARAMIEPTLTPAERTIARSITYRVTLSSNNNAAAGWEHGRRLIVIHGGMIQSFDWIANALIMDRGMGLAGCFPAYLQYFAAGVMDNTSRVAQALPPSLVYSPGAFAARFPGPCHAFTLADFLAKPALAELRSRMMEASIVFLYLHELGHHVLDHVPPDMVDTADAAMHRTQEDAADRWAILAALRARYVLSTAVPWLVFAATFGGNSIESEHLATHPLGIKRDLVLYQQTREWLESHPETWRGTPQDYQTALQNLRDGIDFLQSAIHDMK